MDDNDVNDVLFKEMLLVPGGPPDVVWQLALDTVLSDKASGSCLPASGPEELAEAAGTGIYGFPSEDLGPEGDTDLVGEPEAGSLADPPDSVSEWTVEPEDGFGH